MKTYENYLNELLRQLLELRENNRKYLYRIQDSIPDNHVRMIKNYFLESKEYRIMETRKCRSCKGTWDIIIEILY